ncbi:ATP-binding cassette domain-containing protein [Psychromonas sp. CD1]|uniref:ATP-binding cassette domain-containing protein n=1 Tax=Psychromonas sp. CD1 TaxID=1979839 RepID=UPI002151E32C|nr:ATP-binding cassette domain-containing protein [Psychromonas sp. CD1]
MLYWGVNKKRLSRSVRAQNMGVLAQQSSLSFSFTVEEVVQLGLLPLSLSSRKATQVIDEVMQKVGVSEFKHRAYPSLSGGEKQRVHLARVLVQLSQAGQKAILMLDEPTSALDLAHQHKILSIAREMAEKGAAVIVVLHDLNLAAQYSDRIMVLNNGKIEADGSPWQVLTKQMILAVYGYACLVQKHPIKDHPMIYSIK